MAAVIAQVFACPRCQAEWHRHPLTAKQRAIFNFIRHSIQMNGFAPTNQEIGAEFGGLSQAAVHEHLTNLEKKGYLIRRFNQTRGLTLVETP